MTSLVSTPTALPSPLSPDEGSLITALFHGHHTAWPGERVYHARQMGGSAWQLEECSPPGSVGGLTAQSLQALGLGQLSSACLLSPPAFPLRGQQQRQANAASAEVWSQLMNHPVLERLRSALDRATPAQRRKLRVSPLVVSPAVAATLRRWYSLGNLGARVYLERSPTGQTLGLTVRQHGLVRPVHQHIREELGLLSEQARWERTHCSYKQSSLVGYPAEGLSAALHRYLGGLILAQTCRPEVHRVSTELYHLSAAAPHAVTLLCLTPEDAPEAQP